jgi:restriction system protein
MSRRKSKATTRLLGWLILIPILLLVDLGHRSEAPLLGIGIVAILVVAVTVLAKAAAQRRREIAYVQSGMAEIDTMPGIEFEKYVAARLHNAGWAVRPTAVIGDYGVDLIANKDGQRIAIQCKRYSKPVGPPAVQQVVAGAVHYRCTSSAVVSNQEFTTAAKQLAADNRCRLVGRAKLLTPTLGMK